MVRHIGKFQWSFISVTLIALSTFAGGSIAGKVSIVKGQVFIVRGSEKIQVKKDDTVLESDVIESQAGGTARITMIDSNLVDVYPKSKVEIAKYVYKPNQDQKDVELKVDFGKIKSTVNQKYDGAKNKFQVKTPSAVAGVRGTVFTAEYDAAKKISKVVTIEGLVAVTKMLDRERQSAPVFVRPDQSVKVDPEQSKIEQPRDLKSEEREQRKKEDKDLGYQYDPKKEPTPGSENTEPPKNAQNPPPQKQPDNNQPPKDNGEPPKEAGRPPRSDAGDQANNRGSHERRVKDDQPKEPVVREAPPVKEISAREPVKEIKEVREVREVREVKEPVRTVSDVVKDVVKDVSERRQQRQQEQQERRQAASEDEQAKKQKQADDEQMKRQKQIEDEQAKKQKQADDEQAKKAKIIEDMLAAKRQQAEDAQAKREEEFKKRSEEIAARRAEEARRLAEIAKRAEAINRLPSGSSGSVPGTTTPNLEVPRLTTPKQ